MNLEVQTRMSRRFRRKCIEIYDSMAFTRYQNGDVWSLRHVRVFRRGCHPCSNPIWLAYWLSWNGHLRPRLLTPIQVNVQINFALRVSIWPKQNPVIQYPESVMPHVTWSSRHKEPAPHTSVGSLRDILPNREFLFRFTNRLLRAYLGRATQMISIGPFQSTAAKYAYLDSGILRWFPLWLMVQEDSVFPQIRFGIWWCTWCDGRFYREQARADSSDPGNITTFTQLSFFWFYSSILRVPA